jgi:hypothetical protein
MGIIASFSIRAPLIQSLEGNSLFSWRTCGAGLGAAFTRAAMATTMESITSILEIELESDPEMDVGAWTLSSSNSGTEASLYHIHGAGKTTSQLHPREHGNGDAKVRLGRGFAITLDTEWLSCCKYQGLFHGSTPGTVPKLQVP